MRYRDQSGFTILELMVICAVMGVIFFLGALALTGLSAAQGRSIRISCVNNVKQCELASMVWAGDNNDKLPMEISTNMGGTREFMSGTNVFRYFQVMSNELSTPHVAWCPADTRIAATNFGNDFDNDHVSYFVGLDASLTNRRAWLCGDRNITNGLSAQNGVLTLAPSRRTEWTREMHKYRGNVSFGAGGVKMMSNDELGEELKTSGWTNRIVLPE